MPTAQAEPKIHLLGSDEPEAAADPPSATKQVQEMLGALGLDEVQQQQLAAALGGADGVEKAAQQVLAMAAAGGAGGLFGGGGGATSIGLLAGPSVDEVQAVGDANTAHLMSASYCSSVVSALAGGTNPMLEMQAIEAARALAQLHESGAIASIGRHRSTLLPSGVVLHYQEWGSQSAPPLVLLHDINENRHAWGEVAKLAAANYRVLSVDLRGHGATSRSPRRLYDLDNLVADLDELVVQLSLNGRDWQGTGYTRPWVLGGRGLGAAVASAYAAGKPGRVFALLLVDYDPNWRADRLAFDRFQAAHFASREAAAAALDAILGLRGDPARIGRALWLRCSDADDHDLGMGMHFAMDPFFFASDLTAHNAHSLLRSAARRCHVRLLHTAPGAAHHDSAARAGGHAWTAARAEAIAAELREAGALDTVSEALPGLAELPVGEEYRRLAQKLMALAEAADTDAARKLRQAHLESLARSPGPNAVVAVPPPPTLSDGLSALQATLQASGAPGEDVHALARLGRADRATLKLRLKELGFKGMRQRVKLEEELLELPPP